MKTIIIMLLLNIRGMSILPFASGSPPDHQIHKVLFVEDRGASYFGPSYMPDTLWLNALQRVVGPGNFSYYGPIIVATEPGPPLDTMLNYDVVIWDCYDYLWEDPPALLDEDRANIEAYLQAGGKIWLIGQDIAWGVPHQWLCDVFNLISIYQDYITPYVYTLNVAGEEELEGISFSITAEWQVVDGFWPDELYPDADAHIIFKDLNHNKGIASATPNALPFKSSFWAINLRRPVPISQFDSLIHRMLSCFWAVVQHDVGVAEIKPRGASIPYELPLKVKVNNYGLYPADFDVTIEINGSPVGTQNVSLSPGDSIWVDFGSYNFGQEGDYVITAYTQYSEDENPSNDTLRVNLRAYWWLQYDDETPVNAWQYPQYYDNNGWGMRFTLPEPLSGEGFFADSVAVVLTSYPASSQGPFHLVIFGDTNGMPNSSEEIWSGSYVEIPNVWPYFSEYKYPIDPPVQLPLVFYLFWIDDIGADNVYLVVDGQPLYGLGYYWNVSHYGSMPMFEQDLKEGDWFLRIHITTLGVKEKTFSFHPKDFKINTIAKDVLKISPTECPLNIKFYNISGRFVFSHFLNRKIRYISIRHLKPGVYFLNGKKIIVIK